MNQPDNISVHGRSAVADRRRKVAALLLQQRSVADISKELNLGRQTIYNDAHWVRREWKQESLGSYGDLVTREVMALNEDERKLREKWVEEKSTSTWLRIYDRIFRVGDKRAELLGLYSFDGRSITPERARALVQSLVQIVLDQVPERARRLRIIEGVDALIEDVSP